MKNNGYFEKIFQQSERLVTPQEGLRILNNQGIDLDAELLLRKKLHLKIDLRPKILPCLRQYKSFVRS